MATDAPPPRQHAAKTLARQLDGNPGRDFDRRRRARNWALLAVLLGLSVLFYAITLVKLAKGA
jgi:hypothetical protein